MSPACMTANNNGDNTVPHDSGFANIRVTKCVDNDSNPLQKPNTDTMRGQKEAPNNMTQSPTQLQWCFFFSSLIGILGMCGAALGIEFYMDKSGCLIHTLVLGLQWVL